MNNWRVELTVGGKILAEAKILRGIFLGDVLAPLFFVTAMMLLNHIGNTQANTNFMDLKKINHLMYMDDIKLFAKIKKNWKL